MAGVALEVLLSEGYILKYAMLVKSQMRSDLY